MFNFQSKIKFEIKNCLFKPSIHNNNKRFYAHFKDFFTSGSEKYLAIKVLNWTFLDNRVFVIVIKKSTNLKELESRNNIKIKFIEITSSAVPVLDISDTEFNALRRELPKLRSGLRAEASPKCSLLYSMILKTLDGLSQFFVVNSKQSNTENRSSHIDFDITSTKKPLKKKR